MKLWRYIQGYRKGKDAHKLEKEAMSDPFLAHALRGFDRVEGDHIKQIERLQKEIHRKAVPRIRYLRAVGIAASVLLVIGVGSYFLVNESRIQDATQPAIAMQELHSEENIPAVPPPAIAQQRRLEPQKEVERQNAPKPVVKPDIVEEHSALDVVMAPVEKEMQHVVLEERKKSLTGAVATISPAPSEARKVKGKVTDEQGYPIIGASVQIEGTNEGTITDIDGHYEITAADGSKLRVSYIGYETLDKLVKQDSVMDFAMNEDKQALDEVVVVGYGTHRKSIMKESKPVDGMRKYKKYLKENMSKPIDSECSGVEGKVVLQFYINQQGRPDDITVEQGLCPSADQEAIRLISEGPDWTPSDKPVKLEVKF